MAAEVGSSLEVSREELEQRPFSLGGEWAAEAAGGPLPQEEQVGRAPHPHPRVVEAGGWSCLGPYCALKQHEMGVGVKV